MLLAILSVAGVSALTARPDDAGMITGLLVIVFGQVFASSRRPGATSTMSWLRRRSVNLEAARRTPRVWLVAHLDSKSQTIPMLVRVASFMWLNAALMLCFVSGFAYMFGWIASPHWGMISVLAIAAALPSLLCMVGNKSPGALDNATGVAAVLLASRLLPKERAVGVLITSGEELDLAGARAWSQNGRKGALMINCDTIDEAGTWRCMYVNRPHALGIAAENAAKKLGLALRMGKVIPGIITDSMAFEAAGLPSVTLSRGTVRTLARLHTKSDRADVLTGAGSATAARFLAQMVEETA